jgi:hypothetical protein
MSYETDYGHVPLSEPNWWACDFPERPFNNHVVLTFGCPLCLIHLKAEQHRNPNYGLKWQDRNVVEEVDKALAKSRPTELLAEWAEDAKNWAWIDDDDNILSRYTDTR